MSVAVAAELQGQTTKYVIAEATNDDRIGVAGAELRTLGGAFAPKKTLHISVVYVAPGFRRRGIGGKLIATILDWGRSGKSEQCDLNVLKANPAKSLYENLGFSIVEIKMVRSL
jgi:ribosomal protein S18 acetylase RimI-like enzyme